MKKILITIITAIFLTVGSGIGNYQVETAITKPSQLKDGVKSYKAIVTKKAKVYSFKENKSYYLKKGTSITIVEKIDYGKYHLLTLKGQKYMKVNNDTVKIRKALKEKVSYHKFQLSDTSKKQLSQLGKNHKDYKNYKKYLVYRDAEDYYKMSNLLKELIDMHLYTNEIYGMGLGASVSSDYSYWKMIGKPVYETKIKKTWITK